MEKLTTGLYRLNNSKPFSSTYEQYMIDNMTVNSEEHFWNLIENFSTLNMPAVTYGQENKLKFKWDIGIGKFLEIYKADLQNQNLNKREV